VKFSVEYVKKNPIMFGTIFVVFGLLLWFMMNRGSSSAGATTVVQGGGPSDAQLAAATQVQLAQISAGAQTSLADRQLSALSMQTESQEHLAALSLTHAMAELQVEERLGVLGVEASLAGMTAQLNAQTQMSADNNAFMIDYARVAQDAATANVMINASLQRDLAGISAEAYRTSSLLSIIPTLKKKNRDEALLAIAGPRA
jgi:hypothetical protein